MALSWYWMARYETLIHQTETVSRWEERRTPAAAEYLLGHIDPKSPFPSTDLLREAHAIVFGATMPSAGQLRSDADLRMTAALRDNWDRELDWGKREGSFVMNVERVLTKISQESREYFARARGPDEQAQALLAYHARLVANQSFVDGNKSMALIVTTVQMQQVMQRKPNELNRTAYDIAIEEAVARGHLNHLSSVLLSKELPEHLQQSPHRLSVWPQTIERELPNGVVLPISAENVSEARRFANAPLDPEIGRYVDKVSAERIQIIFRESPDRFTLANKCQKEMEEARKLEKDHSIEQGPKLTR